ncbi:MAG: hypothetical protein NZ521_12330, partial [Flammeovirgaceae bacterium]|nr:hypothetical protein [Flammeovirgaceae bacterium]MDW8289025.1 hypothetical protein [Flammeovirgaceae bacterium]
IDSVWLSEPFVKEVENNTLNIKVVNEGEEEVKSRNLQFFMDGKMIASTNIRVSPKSHHTFQVNFSTEERGIKKCRIQVEDFAVSFDDEYHFILNVAPTIRVTLLGNGSALHYLEEVFKGESFFKVEKYSFQAIDFNALKETDLLVIESLSSIDEALKSSLTEIFLRGKNVVIFPAPDVDELAMSSFFSISARKTKETTDMAVDYASFKHPFFEKIFDKIEPNMSVPQAIAVLDWKPIGQTLISFKNNSPFLSMIPQRKGKLFLFAFPLNNNFTDLHKHALFLPIFYRISLSSQSSETRLAYSFGESTATLTLDSMKRSDIFVMSGNGNEWIPQQRIIG